MNITWSTGSWTHEPVQATIDDRSLLVTAAEGSDAWRETSYDFVHESEHALVAPFAYGSAMEVTFVADFDHQFDQAGLFIAIDRSNWVKAGIEFVDGIPQVGAVVTRGRSDWSVAPVPNWQRELVTIRASWAHDAVTIRARTSDEGFRLVRVFPLDGSIHAAAGPMVCAPTHAGLTVGFTEWTVEEADPVLH